MAWIFVCDRCQKASVDEGMLRRNGEYAGTITIEEKPTHPMHKAKPSFPLEVPEWRPDNQDQWKAQKITLELCSECMNNHAHWVNGLDTIPPHHSEVPASAPASV